MKGRNLNNPSLNDKHKIGENGYENK